MKITLRIEVTAEDIARGKRGDSDACPIALAAQRAYHAWKAEHPGWRIIEKELDADDRITCPQIVRDFLDVFDANNRKTRKMWKMLRPFTFDYELTAAEEGR